MTYFHVVFILKKSTNVGKKLKVSDYIKIWAVNLEYKFPFLKLWKGVGGRSEKIIENVMLFEAHLYLVNWSSYIFF